MTDSESARMLDRAHAPTPASVAAWIGARNFKRWTDLTAFIDRCYPAVFNVEWLFGGKKHGWSLRYKKSKSFCTFIPERSRFRVLIVFGAADREKAEAILAGLTSHVREDYRQSPTYPDGTWMVTTVDSAKALKDVTRLLQVKRRPKEAGR